MYRVRADGIAMLGDGLVAVMPRAERLAWCRTGWDHAGVDGSRLFNVRTPGSMTETQRGVVGDATAG